MYVYKIIDTNAEQKEQQQTKNNNKRRLQFTKKRFYFPNDFRELLPINKHAKKDFLLQFI